MELKEDIGQVLHESTLACCEPCSSVPDLLLLSKSMSHASSDLDVFGVQGRRLLAARPRAMVLTVPIARRLSGEVRT